MPGIVLSMSEIHKQQDADSETPSSWISSKKIKKGNKSSINVITKIQSSSTAKKVKKANKAPTSADQSSETVVVRRARGEITSWAHKRAMLDWLLKDVNFKLITGSATSGMKHPVAGAIVSKKSAYEQMGEYVNQICGTNWTQPTTFCQVQGILSSVQEHTRFI